MVLLAFGATRLAEIIEKSSQLRRSLVIIGLEFHWSVSGKVLERVEMSFVNLKGKSELNKNIRAINIINRAFYSVEMPEKETLDCVIKDIP